MFDTRIPLTGAALLFVVLAAGARPDDPEPAPPPRPVPAAKDEKPSVPTAPLPRPVVAPTEPPPAGRPPEAVRIPLDQLAREWVARKGAVEVAHQRFTAQARELDGATLRLVALAEPKSVPPVLSARDVEPALKSAQQLVEYQTARIGYLEAIDAAIAALFNRCAEFERACAAADAQRQQLGAALAGAENVPAALTPERLTADLERIRTLAADVGAKCAATKTSRGGPADGEVAHAKAAAAAARAQLEELKAGSEAARKAFEFEERVRAMTAQQLTDEFARLRQAAREMMTAVAGDERDFASAGPAVADARARLAAVREPDVPDEPKPPAPLPPLDEAARRLTAAQHYLGARVRAADERAEKTAALIAALDEQERKALAYATTLDRARQTVGELSIVAAEVEHRVGRGDLDPAKAPDPVPDAHSAAARARLAAAAAAVQEALARVRAERAAARRPDPDAETLRGLTTVLRAHATDRLALLADLKRLAADYAAPRHERPEAEQKRTDQRAAERVAHEARPWDRLLALDRSKPATDLSELVEAYYKELVDLDEKADNLKHQRDTLAALIDGTQKEADHVAKLRAVLEKRSAPADLLGSAGEPGGATKVRAALDHLELDDWLAGLLAPTGLKAERDQYHDELARLAVVGAANARRVQTLTGNAPEPNQTRLPATGGEIGAARAELFEARVHGLALTGIKLGSVLVAALILPVIVMRVLRRAIRGGADEAGNPSPVLSALRKVLKVVVWAAALAVVLSVLGFDVTALVVALAIGALAVAVAARPMTADVLGSLAVFADRRFKVGDVVRLGGADPARVVGLTWRSTALRNTNGLVVSVPNRQVTEETVENLSRGTDTYDAFAVTITTDKDAGRVIGVIRAAIAQCKSLAPDHGVTVVSYTQRGPVKVVQYRFWWFLKEYETRNKTRDEVFARIAIGLTQEDMTGIELTLG